MTLRPHLRRRSRHQDPHLLRVDVGSLLPLALLVGGCASDEDEDLYPTR